MLALVWVIICYFFFVLLWGSSCWCRFIFCHFLFDTNNSCLSLLFMNLTEIGLNWWREYFPTHLQLTIGIFVALLNTSCESLCFPGIINNITSVTFSLHCWLFSHGTLGTSVSSMLFSNACFLEIIFRNFGWDFQYSVFNSVLPVGPFGFLYSLIYLACLGNWIAFLRYLALYWCFLWFYWLVWYNYLVWWWWVLLFLLIIHLLLWTSGFHPFSWFVLVNYPVSC